MPDHELKLGFLKITVKVSLYQGFPFRFGETVIPDDFPKTLIQIVKNFPKGKHEARMISGTVKNYRKMVGHQKKRAVGKCPD